MDLSTEEGLDEGDLAEGVPAVVAWLAGTQDARILYFFRAGKKIRFVFVFGQDVFDVFSLVMM